jgi:hypothetical protein
VTEEYPGLAWTKRVVRRSSPEVSGHLSRIWTDPELLRPDLTTTFGASAWACGPDGPKAAVEEAVAGLAGERPALVLMFPEAGSATPEALAGAAAAAPGCPVAGMTSDGVLAAGGVQVGGCAALAFGPGVSVGVGVARHASRDLEAAGRAAVAEAAAGIELRPGHAVVLLFLDPMSGDEAAGIDGAYAVAGARVPLAGGGANGTSPAVIAEGVAWRDAVVAVAIASPAPIAVAVAHGCRPCAEPAIATRTEGRAVRELNGRPAEAVYLEGIGFEGPALDDGAFEALAVLHPLAQPELRGLLRLRHVKGRAEDGGLACATHIPPNAAIWFTEQTPETIVASAGEAVREALALLPDPPRVGLIFDCAARKRALGTALAEEAATLASAFGDVPALTGLYTRGEVGRTQGAKGDRNHAVVVVGFA